MHGLEGGVGTSSAEVFHAYPTETRERLGSREPGAAVAACAQAENPLRLEWEDLNFLARVRLRVIDPDLKHGKAFF